MKTAMKKVLSLTLALVLLIGVFPVTALAARNDDSDSSYFRQENDRWHQNSNKDKWPQNSNKDENEDTQEPDQEEDTQEPEQKEDTQEPDQEEDTVAPIHMVVKVSTTENTYKAVWEEDIIPSNGSYAIVENLLTYYYWNEWEDNYTFDHAYNMTTKQDAARGDSVKAGEEIHIALNHNNNDDPNESGKFIKMVVKVDGEIDEVVTEIDPSNGFYATVQNLLTYYYNPNWEANYTFSNAYNMTSNKTALLGSGVKAGDEIHINLNEIVTPPVDPNPGDGDDSDTTTDKCVKCEGALTEYGACNGCLLDQTSCTCTAAPEDNTGKVKLTLVYNYKGAADTEMYFNRNLTLLEMIGQIPAPTRDGYLFDRWTLDAKGHETIDRNDRVSNRGTTKIYAQWTEQVQVVGKGYDIKVNLNYNRKMGETLKNVAKGTTMADALEYINTPYRHGYKFLGWYWDANCKNDVERNDKVLKDCEIYAKWERINTEVMLKIYLNENVKSSAKIIDLYDYAKDDRITMDEVSDIVNKYYKAASSKDDMDIDGLFTAKTWNNGRYNMRNAEKTIHIDDEEDTVIYVMVRDAKARSSSSSGTADSTNPKTGDMIFTSITVLGASASCLAVLFYLNKKRAV